MGLGLVVAAALIGRRWRLARDLLLSGVVAWALARVLGAVVVQHAGFTDSIDAITRLGISPSFPLVRLAVVVAIVAAASPYLTRLTRRIGMLLWVVLALAALYLGTAYPNDIVAALVLGWGVAAAIHLLFGSPGGRPTTAQVTAALEELGVKPVGVHLAPMQPTSGATLMLGDDDQGPLWVKVIGRDEADAQFLTKLWRFAIYKDGGPTFFWTRLQAVEHEAYATLRARDAGVRVASVVTAATAGPGVALLVERRIGGTHLADLDPASVTTDLLDDLWGQVDRLRDGHLAHGELNAAHVVVNDDGPTIVGFASSSVAGVDDRRPHDVAELLASTAAIVGTQPATDVARRGVGPDSLARALPLLQPAALTRQTRTAAGRADGEQLGPRARRKELHNRLEDLRELGAAAGTKAPALETFGASLSFWTILVINIGIGTLASLVPRPGGSVAVSSIGFSGALTAFGVPTDVAVSAILTHQIVVSYVPAVVGWFATTDMIRRDYL